MRKIFTFLFAALMSVGMYATTVTWNSSTFSSIDLFDGQSITQDGVTLTVLDGMIAGWDGNWMGNSSDASFKFSTSLGNFTRIEITGDIRELGGSGWTQTSPGAVWTGDANETTFGMYFRDVTQIVFTIEEPAPAAKYYIVGTMNSWGVDENYEMNPSLEAETEEYFYTLDLTTTSEFKVVKVQNGQQSWIPEGMGNNYGQNGEITEDGEYTVYFRPNFDGEGEDWFYSCIYAEKTGEFVPETPTYYLVGSMTEWDVDENYELNPNIDSDIEEYFYVLDLTTSSQFKVVKVQNGQQTWYPSGMDNNYGQNGEITEDGEYTIYFRPNYDGGEDWFYNCIYVSKNEPEPEPADEYAEIVWTEPVAKADLAADATFTAEGSLFSATVADDGDKMEIDANVCRFGTAEDYKSYSHRLKSGGASSSTKNFITLNIPEAGKIRIAPRTGSNNDTTRTLVIEQAGAEIYRAVVRESQAIEITEGEQQVKVYPYVEVAVAAGSVRVSYTAGMNFYGFGFKAASSLTAVENTAVETKAIKRIVNGQLLIEKNGKLFNVTGALVR